MQERDCLIALNRTPGLSSLRINKLLCGFTSAAAVAQAEPIQLCAVGGISRDVAAALRAEMDPARVAQEKALAAQAGVDIVTSADRNYPDMLRHIHDPPPVLYVKGSPETLSGVCVAMVGCRRASWYGRQQAERLAGGLAGRGVCIVSGLARGIDTAAHQGALRSGGRTIAVCGCGFPKIYPPENKDLAIAISGQGAVITEFPMGVPPLPGNFPRRNRIISGLSRAIVVVEAAQRSGSLITARLGLEQGKEVLAVPGAANAPHTQGTHQLIRDGARLVERAQDIFEELNIPWEPSPGTEGESAAGAAALDEASQRVLAVLSREPVHIDLVSRHCRLEQSEVFRSLLRLQLAGLVRDIGGKRFCRQ